MKFKIDNTQQNAMALADAHLNFTNTLDAYDRYFDIHIARLYEKNKSDIKAYDCMLMSKRWDHSLSAITLAHEMINIQDPAHVVLFKLDLMKQCVCKCQQPNYILSGLYRRLDDGDNVNKKIIHVTSEKHSFERLLSNIAGSYGPTYRLIASGISQRDVEQEVQSLLK
jgi:hypothetical protein